MKFLHLADLHIGKRLNEFNLVEDQKFILDQILEIAHDDEATGLLICGDVYDKSQPSSEAIKLLDHFLTELARSDFTVLMISGNHDSPERLGFGSRIMESAGLHIAGRFSGNLEKVSLHDEHGALNFYLLPFIRPPHVRPHFEHEIKDYQDAVRAVLSTQKIDTKERNVLLAHQFVISGSLTPELSDSETISVGSLDEVDASLFADFDYVALGHLHRPQNIGGENIRYAGSPLKYSFSEVRHTKSVTILEFGPKGEIDITERALTPLRDLREIKGPLEELLKAGKEAAEGQNDYFRIILTDQEELYDPLGQLRTVYPNLMSIEFENRKHLTGEYTQITGGEEIGSKNPLDLFAHFYLMQNDQELTEEQTAILEEVFREAGGDEL